MYSDEYRLGYVDQINTDTTLCKPLFTHVQTLMTKIEKEKKELEYLQFIVITLSNFFMIRR